jgi:ABC-type phosphate transport system substrate-binding protein
MAYGSAGHVRSGAGLAEWNGGPSGNRVQEGESTVPKPCRLALAGIAFLAATASATGTQEFHIIAHPTVQGTKISRANLSALFTGKTTRWGDKAEARPVDQSARAPVRRAFTAAIIGLSLGELQLYWQKRIATDHVFPPPTKSSDEEVLGYVAAHEGAIGYVGSDAAIPENVKVLAVVD